MALLISSWSSPSVVRHLPTSNHSTNLNRLIPDDTELLIASRNFSFNLFSLTQSPWMLVMASFNKVNSVSFNPTRNLKVTVKLFFQPPKWLVGLIIFKLCWFTQLFFSLGELLIKVSSSTRRNQECAWEIALIVDFCVKCTTNTSKTLL